MKISVIAFIYALLSAFDVLTGGLQAQTPPVAAAPPADAASRQEDVNNPENTLPTEEQRTSPQSAYFGRKTDRAVSAHKVNYFAINHWPSDSNAQVKFQISMKFRVLEPNLYVLRYNLFPAYIGYTQKSLWNEGQKSMPFEESDYNPEFFLDYPVNVLSIGRVKLRNIIIAPLEHESNGLAGNRSRSWNRQYIMLRFGLESREKLEVPNSFLADKALLYVKLWRASGYSGQNDYLRAVGSKNNFLDYMGQGEAGISVRNFLWGGSLKNHQLDLKTPLFRYRRKKSYGFEFRQQLPRMNFALYFQYWYGYGETLLRFDRLGHRSFAGLSFSY
ncbi:MAG: hypothetical protein A2X28_07945 [Elusimicrobia bacterium GWA2_56_46]|nr:MAG: hypothetical protein A2X28_07945 [Elusimicrobia bacterium GWA2_56_46]OGR54312.1 MAG: hypothetical protein A2X39_03765 [Elusimicrobia bacterium GWC2_56_31]HBB66549.1 hypothetical protein [Elusimicrobiota bacterium]HBW22401.1 hypothetical protein [Elusimicrobiota bacterium]